MKNLKTHFKFTKQQRNGIFLLFIIIVALQATLYWSKQKHQTNIVDSNPELLTFQAEIDSLKKIEVESRQPKLYPFNPNFITDYKGYTLGMSNDEINRLLTYRAKDKWINSAKEFQQVTGVSDSLLNIIEPYFKFPEWVTKPKPKISYSSSYSNTIKRYSEKIDLNKATSYELQKVYGIGEKLADRIIKYRSKYAGGFIADVQLNEVYGLSPEVIERILQQFTVKTPREIKRININTATRDELVSIQYIDYEIAYNIIEARTLREGFKTLEDLTKVKDFPVHKIEIIKLYLTLD